MAEHAYTHVRVLFAHGHQGSPRGEMAIYLAHNFTTHTPGMNTADYASCLKMHQEAIETLNPTVLVGESFGGTIVYDLIKSGKWSGPCVLIAPEIKKMGREGAAIPPGVGPVIILHGQDDQQVDPRDSKELVECSHGNPLVKLYLVDDDHTVRKTIERDQLKDFILEACRGKGEGGSEKTEATGL